MLRASLLALFVLFVPFSAHALESAPVVSDHARVTLASEGDSYRPGQSFRLGLHFRLSPGWHIYWRNPGDAGSPPEITWTLPGGVTAGAIDWPAPVRVSEGPVVSYAYTGEVMLPVTLTATETSGPLSIVADANWLVCEKICVPEQGRFTLALPSGASEPSALAPLFAAADARHPLPSPFAARIGPEARLFLTGLAADTIQDAWFFPTEWGEIDQNAPQTVQRLRKGVVLKLVPGPQFKPDQPLSGLLALTEQGGTERYFALTAEPGPIVGDNGALAPFPASERNASAGILRILLLALAGGLILNLMPCVFPVLALKALAIARLSGHEQRSVRLHALSYSVGVLVMFLACGLALLGLRAAGATAGWGFQFQSPIFVVAMTWLMFAIGLNLSGVFEIGGSVTGLGQNLAARQGALGSFFAGLLAVVVATPCTAPFMGSAIAAAATAPRGLALGIFAALGIGLALPYLVLASWPRLATLLPRPGAWMEILRQLLAFPMYGAAIWLLWVASRQTGSTGVLATAAGMGLLGLAAWALGLAQKAGTLRGQRVGRTMALLATLAALALLPALRDAGPDMAKPVATDGSEPFSTVRLATLRAEGRPVFIDMTAAWCVTCLVNERVALAPSSVRQVFAARNIAYLKGDWTNQNPEITAYLRAAGHDGVPLYVYYPPRGEPVILPQLLTPEIVLAYLTSPQG